MSTLIGLFIIVTVILIVHFLVCFFGNTIGKVFNRLTFYGTLIWMAYGVFWFAEVIGNSFLRGVK